jgi:hypothetical protein
LLNYSKVKINAANLAHFIAAANNSMCKRNYKYIKKPTRNLANGFVLAHYFSLWLEKKGALLLIVVRKEDLQKKASLTVSIG